MVAQLHLRHRCDGEVIDLAQQETGIPESAAAVQRFAILPDILGLIARCSENAVPAGIGVVDHTVDDQFPAELDAVRVLDPGERAALVPTVMCAQ